ncbi:unnamed protein product [Linum trigynum]|uniref:Uncharacterized protein n=1 Tax=Linum trigynum TaxID=586398 RepID=A0AAV2CMX5_9ROSI
MNISSLHGIVSLPMGWLKPNSSSANRSKTWNDGLFKKDTGMTNLFLLPPSPTYTATNPLGTSEDIEEHLRGLGLGRTLGQRIAIFFSS